VTSCIAKLRLVLLMLLLHLLLVVYHVHISSVDILHKSNGLWALLRDLNLASSHSVGDDMLGGCGTVLHVGYLSLSLGSTLSDSLDCRNDLLLVLSLISGFVCLLSRLGLVNLKFKDSVVRSCSPSNRSPTNTSISLRGLVTSFSRGIWELALIALWGINPTSDWAMTCVLVWDL